MYFLDNDGNINKKFAIENYKKFLFLHFLNKNYYFKQSDKYRFLFSETKEIIQK